MERKKTKKPPLPQYEASVVQMGQASFPSREQQRIRELEAEAHNLRKQIGEKEKVIDILEKMRLYPVETIEEKHRCVEALSHQGVSVGRVCQELGVSRSGYYDWVKRKSL